MSIVETMKSWPERAFRLKRLGIQQQDLVKKSGIAASTFCSAINQTRQVRADTFDKIESTLQHFEAQAREFEGQ